MKKWWKIDKKTLQFRFVREIQICDRRGREEVTTVDGQVQQLSGERGRSWSGGEREGPKGVGGGGESFLFVSKLLLLFFSYNYFYYATSSLHWSC